MQTEDLLKRITVNPEVMVGKPTIRGRRITVEQILKALAGGVSATDFLRLTLFYYFYHPFFDKNLSNHNSACVMIFQVE